jgi:nitrate reductase NapE component
MARTFALDAVPVCNLPLSVLLVPTLRFDVWMFQLVMVISEDVF